MKIVPNKSVLVLAVLMLSFIAQASPSNPPPPPTPPPPGLPLDQGLVFLVIAAILYGTYKIIQIRNNKKNPI